MPLFSFLPSGARSADTTRSQLSGSFDLKENPKKYSQGMPPYFEVGDVQLNGLLEGQLQYLQYTHKTYERIRMYRKMNSNSTSNNMQTEESIQLYEQQQQWQQQNEYSCKRPVLILGSEDERDRSHLIENNHQYYSQEQNAMQYDTQHVHNANNVLIVNDSYVQNESQSVKNNVKHSTYTYTQHVHNASNDEQNVQHVDCGMCSYGEYLSALSKEHCRKQKVLDWVMKIENSFDNTLDSEESLNDFEDFECDKNNKFTDINLEYDEQFEDSLHEIFLEKEVQKNYEMEFVSKMRAVSEKTKNQSKAKKKRQLRVSKWLTACLRIRQ